MQNHIPSDSGLIKRSWSFPSKQKSSFFKSNATTASASEGQTERKYFSLNGLRIFAGAKKRFSIQNLDDSHKHVTSGVKFKNTNPMLRQEICFPHSDAEKPSTSKISSSNNHSQSQLTRQGINNGCNFSVLKSSVVGQSETRKKKSVAVR